MTCQNSYFVCFNTVLMMCRHVEVKENPYKIPDITRLTLFDSYGVKYCIVPSRTNGIINTETVYLNV